MLQWKIFMVMALIGHILCGISDGFLTYAPNGKVDLTNFKDYEKSKVAFHGMPLKNLSVAMLLGVCAMTLEIFGYIAAACNRDPANKTSGKSKCNRGDHVCRVAFSYIMVTFESRELSAFLLYRNYLVKKYKIKENIKKSIK